MHLLTNKRNQTALHAFRGLCWGFSLRPISYGSPPPWEVRHIACPRDRWGHGGAGSWRNFPENPAGQWSRELQLDPRFGWLWTFAFFCSLTDVAPPAPGHPSITAGLGFSISTRCLPPPSFWASYLPSLRGRGGGGQEDPNPLPPLKYWLWNVLLITQTDPITSLPETLHPVMMRPILRKLHKICPCLLPLPHFLSASLAIVPALATAGSHMFLQHTGQLWPYVLTAWNVPPRSVLG